VRAKLDECFPRLQYVASQSFGSVVGEETSQDGMGYGPMFQVTRYEFSTAFLVTESFKDTDSLAARMIQSRFTGHYRFACKAWYEWVNDPTNSAPGSNNPDSKFQAEDFNSPYDRNLLLIATILFDESYRNELCDVYDDSGCSGYAYGFLDPIQFWKEQCESPAGWRNAVPTHMWERDANVYTSVEDQLGHAVEDWMIAPLRAFGSLRQLQDVSKELAGAHFNEDYTEMNTKKDSNFVFTGTRRQRSNWNPFKFYRERICDPEYHMSIEEVAGNAPHWETEIRDTSRSILFHSDMVVPASLRGESNFEGTENHPNVCPEGEACDLTNKPTYRESSMLQLVYVRRCLPAHKHVNAILTRLPLCARSQITSSHDPNVMPGVYRLLDAPIWPKIPCAELPNQRCGLERRLVEHGRSRPSCNFLCSLGRGVARVGVGLLSIGSAFADLMDPLGLGNSLRFDRGAVDDLVAYINNPIGDQTYAVQPYSGIGRAALYGVSPLIFGYGGRRLHSILLEHVENVTREEGRRRLNVPNDFKSVQVDWTNDAVFFPAYINRDLQLGTFARQQAPITYQIGRKALFSVRCVPLFVTLENVPDARTCNAQASDWYEGITGTVINQKGVVTETNAECYEHSLKVVSSPRRHSPIHFLSRFVESPPPPLPPPSSPPPTPPEPPSPSPPPSPPIGFTADEMRNKINLVQAYAAKINPCISTPTDTSDVVSRPQEILRHRLFCVGPVAVLLPGWRDGHSVPAPRGRVYSKPSTSTASAASTRAATAAQSSDPRIGGRARVSTRDLGGAPQHILCTGAAGAGALAAAGAPCHAFSASCIGAAPRDAHQLWYMADVCARQGPQACRAPVHLRRDHRGHHPRDVDKVGRLQRHSDYDRVSRSAAASVSHRRLAGNML
jgi:hypothetical protein